MSHIYELPEGRKNQALWIPSALYGPTHGGLTIYVRYHAVTNNKIVLKANNNNYVWVDTPDRELVMVNNAHGSNGLRPLDENYDEAIMLSPFHMCGKDAGVKCVMTNYPQHLQRKDACMHHRKEGFKHNGVRCMSDSGGFQLMSGRLQYLDPKKVVEWYNTNTDYGMVLDLPTSVDDWELLKQTAEIQRNNTNIMLDHKANHVELLNITHGYTIQQQLDFHELVKDDRVDMVAIGGSYLGELMQSFARIFGTVCGMPNYKLYHLLGVFNLGVLPFMVRANARGLIPGTITFDSSTHIQSARTRMYHLQRIPNRPHERMIIGLNNPSTARPNPFKLLPCECPVCQTIKYMDVFSIISGAIPTYLLMMHNIYEINRYTNMMNEYAHTLDDKQFTDLMVESSSVQAMKYNGYQVQVEGQLGNHNAKKVVKSIMEFLRRIEDSGSTEKRVMLSKQNSGDDNGFSSYTKRKPLYTRAVVEEVSDAMNISLDSSLTINKENQVTYYDVFGEDVSHLDGDNVYHDYKDKLIKRIIKRYKQHTLSSKLSGKKEKDTMKKNGGSMYTKVGTSKVSKKKLKVKSKLREITNRLSD